MGNFTSMSQVKRSLEIRASAAIKLTIDEMFKVFQKHLNDYYKEPVFNGGSSSQPLEYNRTYKFLNSLLKTDVVCSNKGIYCKIEIDQDYLNYVYTGGASGLDVANYANTKTHGGKVYGDIEFWKDAIEELGGKNGILSMLKINLIKKGVPIIN